jgi:hypothetical protein
LTSLFSHGSQTHSPLRARSSSFHHFHLLPATFAAALGAREKYLCPDSRRNARPLRFLSRGLCHHAGAHSSAHKRAGQRYSFHRDSSIETARIAALAPQKTLRGRTNTFGLRVRRRFSSPFLATALLRFQCLESKQESRKTSLHAHESAQKKIGRSSPRLALEQLFLLLKSQKRIDSR